MKFVIPVVLAFVFTACGGSSSGEDAVLAPVQSYAPMATASTPASLSGMILFIGDSTQAAASTDVIGQTLHVPVDNVAVGGSTTVDMVANLHDWLVRSSATHVVENYGMNDAGFITMDQYADNLRFFISRVRLAGKIPVLEEPNPNCRTDEENIRLSQYVARLNQVAQQENVTLIQQHDYIKINVPHWYRMMDGVCIHPGPTLYAFKAIQTIRYLNALGVGS